MKRIPARRRDSGFSQQGTTDMLPGIRDKLQEAMQRRDKPQEKFIPRNSLSSIWTEKCLRVFAQQYSPFYVSDIPNVRKNFLQTLSILVEMNWDRDRWHSFRTIFIEHEGRSDQNVPTYDLRTLESDYFLGPSWGSTFLSTRDIFCPLDIEEGMNERYEPGRRLPFLDSVPSVSEEYAVEGAHIIKGEALRKVTKEIVADGHLILRGGATVTGVRYYACKRFRSRDDFHRERRNLLELKNRIERHERIMPFFATITVGHDFYLLFDWADTDLEKLLRGEPGDKRLCDLIAEAHELAGALAYLHGGSESQQLFCHMDLKPANILVFKHPGNPVGQWKISDFGNSIGALPKARFPDDVTFPSLPPVAIEDKYQSPEVFHGKVSGTKSDVWSLGCVLVRILAFGMGGGEWESLDAMLCPQAVNGRPDHRVNCFHRHYDPVILNPHIEEWVKGLPTRANDKLPMEACQRLRSLLLRALEVDKVDRLTAVEVKSRLNDISRMLSPLQMLPLPPVPRKNASYLYVLISENDISELRSLLEYDIDVDAVVKEERLLIHAIRKESYEAVDSLLYFRPRLDKESPSSDGRTPMSCAISTGNAGIVNRLIEAGVNVDAPSENGMTPLMIATSVGHVEIVSSLLCNGANYLAYDSVGYTCLHYVAWAPRGDELIREFASKKIPLDIGMRDNDERPFSTLIKAQSNFNPDCEPTFSAFMDAQVDINLADRKGRTALYHAVRNNLEQVTTVLLKHKATYGTKRLPTPSWVKKPWMKKALEARPAQPRRSSTTSTIFGALYRTSGEKTFKLIP